jgi:hypothetical protein
MAAHQMDYSSKMKKNGRPSEKSRQTASVRKPVSAIRIATDPEVKIPDNEDLRNTLPQLLSDKTCKICSADAFKPSDNMERRKVAEDNFCSKPLTSLC